MLSADSSIGPYDALAISPKTVFIPVQTSVTFAVIDENVDDWDAVAEAIENSTGDQILEDDRLDAVFLRKDAVTTFQTALSKRSSFSTLESSTRYLDATSDQIVLDKVLPSSRGSDRLFLVIVDSLDRAIDLMTLLSSPIQQLAILGSRPQKTASYFRKWVASAVSATGCIYEHALPGKM